MELKSRKTRQQVIEWIQQSEYDAVVCIDGMDDAFMGCTPSGVAVYNLDRIVEIVMEDDEMTEEEAIDYVQFNIVDAYIGEKTPIFVEMFI